MHAIVYYIEVGQLLLFPGGELLHGGDPIHRGRRYILAGFLVLTMIMKVKKKNDKKQLMAM